METLILFCGLSLWVLAGLFLFLKRQDDRENEQPTYKRVPDNVLRKTYTDFSEPMWQGSTKVYLRGTELKDGSIYFDTVPAQNEDTLELPVVDCEDAELPLSDVWQDAIDNLDME